MFLSRVFKESSVEFNGKNLLICEILIYQTLISNPVFSRVW